MFFNFVFTAGVFAACVYTVLCFTIKEDNNESIEIPDDEKSNS